MLDEISNLVINLNISIKEKKIVNIKKISPSTLVGKGVMEEIKKKVKTLKINLLICNCSLTPAQLEAFLHLREPFLRKSQLLFQLCQLLLF